MAEDQAPTSSATPTDKVAIKPSKTWSRMEPNTGKKISLTDIMRQEEENARHQEKVSTERIPDDEAEMIRLAMELSLQESQQFVPEEERKPASILEPPSVHHDLLPDTAGISAREAAAVEQAIRLADQEEEAKSLQLAIQLQEEEEQRQRQRVRHQPQGNVRTATHDEASSSRDAPLAVHHSSYQESSTGYRMNSNSTHDSQWTRHSDLVVGPNDEVRTKHDIELHSAANAYRLGVDEFGSRVGNKAFNSFMMSTKRQRKKGVATHGSGRAGSDADGTRQGALDPAVRVHISKAVNKALIERCNGVVKEGKEALLYHANQGTESGGFDVAVKIFKRIQEFRGRGDYVEGDPRYARENFKKKSVREQLELWCEKEFRNLVRANRARVAVPTPLYQKSNLLFMRFVGEGGWPSPQIRELDLRIGSKRWRTLYKQVVDSVRKLYRDARLVHGDLSEYNILVAPARIVENYAASIEDPANELQAVLIDFGQAVDTRHPEAEYLLRRDLKRVNAFFARQGVRVTDAETLFSELTTITRTPSTERCRVCIVGAGASGLRCAKSLVEKYGVNFNDIIILEARDRAGGRIYTEEHELVSGEHILLDLGAAWVHGTGHEWKEHLDDNTAKPEPNPMMHLLLKACGSDYEKLYGQCLVPTVLQGNPWSRPRTVAHEGQNITIYHHGKQVDSQVVDAALHRHEYLRELAEVHADKLYDTGNGLETIHQSLESVLDGARKNENPSSSEIELLAGFYLYLIECWYGCDPSRIPLAEFDEFVGDAEYTEEGDLYGPHCTVATGMKTVLGPLLTGRVEERIQLARPVTKVTNHGSCVLLETGDGNNIEADVCVMTISSGCMLKALREGVFQPDLSASKRDAFEHTEMGVYKKVFLQFDRMFWSKLPPLLGFVGTNASPLGKYLLADNLWAKNGLACLEVILSGRAGFWAINKDTFEIRDAVLDFLRDSIGDCADCVDCHVTRWEEDPFSLGAYSHSALGTTPCHKNDLTAPEWNGRLVFAGEATVSGYEGSVHAALFSGSNAAKQVASYMELR